MRSLRLWAPPNGPPEDVVHALLAMQAQEHAYARWSVGQRTRRATAAEVDAAFDDGRILRTHVLRPTWHYVGRDDLRWLLRLSGPVVHAGNRRRYEELGLDVRTLARAADVLATAVSGTSLTRAEVADVLQRRGIAVDGGRLAYLLMYAELHAAICSGPMRGKHHTYAAVDDRTPPRPGPDGAEALGELARRYFATRGPATAKDFAWWSGLRAADVQVAVAEARATLDAATVGGRTYLFADTRSRRLPGRADLVQCYDEVVISYAESRDVLATSGVDFAVPGHLDGFTHVALLDGRLLGHWRAARRGATTTVEIRPARPLSSTDAAALDDAAARYVRFSDH